MCGSSIRSGVLLFIMEEIWKDIKDCEGRYQISNIGRVKSLARDVVCGMGNVVRFPERILKPQNTTDGYFGVNIKINGKYRLRKIHRFVAQAFIPNPNDLPQVNHIDGNKLNNSVENLEWVTPHENILHSWKVGLSTSHDGYHGGGSPRRAVVLTHKDTGDILRFPSIGDATRYFCSDKERARRLERSNIIAVLSPSKPKRVTYHGYYVRYE